MIYDNVIEQIQESEKNTEVIIVKLGEVTSVTPGGRAYVKLYGDGSPSTKLYTYIDGYFPAVGDKVALLPQGKTYIILGKINEKDPVEIYAKIKWVEENFCPVEYKHKLEDAADSGEVLSFSGYSLIPTTDDKDSIGSATKNIKEIFIKKLTLDGESFTKIYQDRIFVVSGNNTYSLIATLSGTNVNLLPSTNDSWSLGSSSYKLKEIWTGLFRGAWKSGQSTERQLSWNSSNALVPDSSEAVDLGTSSLKFKDLYIRRMIGALAHDNTNGYIAWDSATILAPSATNSIDLGTAAKQFNKIYTNSIYLNGTEFIPANITVDKLHIVVGQQSRNLTLSGDGNGTYLLPSINNNFKLGSSSYKFAEIFATKFTGDLTGNVTGDLTGSLKDGNSYTMGFDSSHNLVPSATDAVSLGTSSKEYNKVYTKELYLNGTKFDPSGVTSNSLVDGAKSLTLTATTNGADILPSDNGTFNLGSSSYKMKNIYADELHADLTGDIKDGTYRIGFDNNHTLYPSTSNVINLGSSTYQFNKTYTKELYINGTQFDPSGAAETNKLTDTYGTYTRTLTMTAASSGASIVPSQNNTFNFGSSSYKFNNMYASTFNGDLDGAVKDGNSDIKFDANHNWIPSTTNFMSLGTSNKQFKNVYGQNIYVNGTAVSSDRRKKEDISPLDWRYEEFFKQLKPVSFKYKDGTSGRKHTGLIAQEVEEAAEKAGLSDKDLAVVVKDLGGSYYLRYEEIIAVQTKVIQELMAKLETLESEKKFMESKMNKLESRLKKIEQFLFEQ